MEPGKLPRRKLHEEEISTGILPDYRGMQRYPFRPSFLDIRRPGRWFKQNLWEIPLSTGTPGGKLDQNTDSQALNLASSSHDVQEIMGRLLQDLERPFPS